MARAMGKHDANKKGRKNTPAYNFANVDYCQKHMLEIVNLKENMPEHVRCKPFTKLTDDDCKELFLACKFDGKYRGSHCSDPLVAFLESKFASLEEFVKTPLCKWLPPVGLLLEVCSNPG